MSLIDEFMTPEEQWQTTENFRLAREFLREYLDDPGSFRDLVNGNTIVLLPSAGPDDVELTHMNLQMAHELAQQGRDVITYEVGARLERCPVQLSPMRGRG